MKLLLQDCLILGNHDAKRGLGGACDFVNTTAKAKLGLTPTASFEEQMAVMVREDLVLAKRDELVKDHSYRTMNTYE